MRPGPRQIGGFSPAALDLLDAYAWPGNLDELAQAVAEAYKTPGGRRSASKICRSGLRVAAQAAAVPAPQGRNHRAGRVSRPRRAGIDPPGVGPSEGKQDPRSPFVGCHSPAAISTHGAVGAGRVVERKEWRTSTLLIVWRPPARQPPRG